MQAPCRCNSMGYYCDNRTHYTISQSTVWYDTQLTNDSLTTVIVFRCRNYPDSFFSYVHLFSDIPSSDNAFSIYAGFASDRIGRVYVYSTNMADLIFFHKTLTFRTIIEPSCTRLLVFFNNLIEILNSCFFS